MRAVTAGNAHLPPVKDGLSGCPSEGLLHLPGDGHERAQADDARLRCRQCSLCSLCCLGNLHAEQEMSPRLSCCMHAPCTSFSHKFCCPCVAAHGWYTLELETTFWDMALGSSPLASAVKIWRPLWHASATCCCACAMTCCMSASGPMLRATRQLQRELKSLLEVPVQLLPLLGLLLRRPGSLVEHVPEEAHEGCGAYVRYHPHRRRRPLHCADSLVKILCWQDRGCAVPHQQAIPCLSHYCMA